MKNGHLLTNWVIAESAINLTKPKFETTVPNQTKLFPKQNRHNVDAQQTPNIKQVCKMNPGLLKQTQFVTLALGKIELKAG